MSKVNQTTIKKPAHMLNRYGTMYGPWPQPGYQPVMPVYNAAGWSQAPPYQDPMMIQPPPWNPYSAMAAWDNFPGFKRAPSWHQNATIIEFDPVLGHPMGGGAAPGGAPAAAGPAAAAPAAAPERAAVDWSKKPRGIYRLDRTQRIEADKY